MQIAGRRDAASAATAGSTSPTSATQPARIQLLASRDDLGEELHQEFRELDLGDWVGAEGDGDRRPSAASCRSGSPSSQLLSKALRALPKEGHGPTDAETRYRERYLDLIVNPEARRIFEIRSATIASVRETLPRRGFREVETPVLRHARPAAPRRSRSSPTTTRSTSTCTCGSRSSCR